MQDNIKLNETIKGYYFLEQDGKIIAKGNNLIVNDGRDFIYYNLLSKIGLINNDENEYKDYNFYKIYADGKKASSGSPVSDYMTIPTTRLADLNQSNPLLSYNISKESTSVGAYISKDTDNRRLKLSLSIVGDSQSYCITEFFVTIKNQDNENSDEKLFSRFLIDPIYLTAGSSYNLVYYIGF